MALKKSFWRKIFSGVSIACLLFNSVLPYGLVSTAYAQDSTTSATLQATDPTPTDTPSPTPSDTPSPTPTDTPSSTPTDIPSPTPSIDPSPTATPSAIPEPSPEATASAIPTPEQDEILDGASTESASMNQGKIPLRKAADFLKNSKKQTNKNYVEGEVIVKFKREKIDIKGLFGKAQAFVFEKKFSLEKKDEIRGLNIQVFRSKKSTEELVKELKSHPDVEYAQPNYIYEPTTISTNDTYRDLLWGLDNTGQTVSGTVGTNDADIDAPEAWGVSEGSGNVIVAVIDSGVAYNHPDLLANMWDGSGCKDEDGSALGSCNHGYDFENNDKTPSPTTSSHGTHIAGTIAAAKNNGKGIIGVSPQAKIMAIKTMLSTTEIVKGISFAEYNGAKIINASWGGSYEDTALKNAISGFDGLFITASGNGTFTIDWDGVGKNNDSSGHIYPCDFDSANIICVAATDQSDSLATFSNYGATSVDVGAPGVNIYSTVPSETTVLNETFESAAPPAIPTGWTKEGVNNNWRTWPAGESWGNVLWGDYNNPYTDDSDTSVTSPTYNLSTTSGASISFWAYCDTQYNEPTNSDYMALEYSGDGGSNFTEV